MRQRSIISVALLAIVLVAGCAKKADDAALVTNIKSQMFSDSQLKDSSLQVTASQGKVTLSGTVPSDAAHLEAYKIASQTAGVANVVDQITVESAQTPPPSETASASTAEPAPAPETPRKARAKRHRPEVREAQPEDTMPPPAPADSAPAVQPVAEPAPAPAPPPPPQPRDVQIPAGTTVTIRMIDGVDSSVNRAGEIFHASLEAPLVVGNDVVVPKGADIYVRLVSASSAGRMTGKSELHLELIKMEFQGRSYPLVSSTYSLAGDSRGKNTAKKVGAGAVIGTLIGAIAGGGKGAAIGAGVGAAGGGVYQAATRGKQVRIPSETKLDFQLDQPVTVTVMPRSASLSE
jgi:FtsZ-interacting cell division protein ZipA